MYHPIQDTHQFPPASEQEAIQALNELQQSLHLNRSSAQRWERQVRAERRSLG